PRPSKAKPLRRRSKPPSRRHGARPRRLPFFFQAEDGIRGRNVTGVQTCALPICPYRDRPIAIRTVAARFGRRTSMGPNLISVERSEERRVGKERRSGFGEGREEKKGDIGSLTVCVVISVDLGRKVENAIVHVQRR